MDSFIYNEEKRYVMISFKGHIINFDIDEDDMAERISYQGFELTDGTSWNMEWCYPDEEGYEPTVVIYGVRKDSNGYWERTDEDYELINKFKIR